MLVYTNKLVKFVYIYTITHNNHNNNQNIQCSQIINLPHKELKACPVGYMLLQNDL